MRMGWSAAGLAMALWAMPAGADQVQTDLQLATSLMGQLQACVAGGLGHGITPAPEDIATVRRIIAVADPLLHDATLLARKTSRTPQEDLLMQAWAEGSLAMLKAADDYRMEHGY